jgi:hypothetical protein
MKTKEGEKQVSDIGCRVSGKRPRSEAEKTDQPCAGVLAPDSCSVIAEGRQAGLGLVDFSFHHLEVQECLGESFSPPS